MKNGLVREPYSLKAGLAQGVRPRGAPLTRQSTDEIKLQVVLDRVD
jgi:hypothetical protein